MKKLLTLRSRGQTMVLVALAAIALVAFVALAVDGGNAFAVRRQSQTAADGASMAGAYTALNYQGAAPVADIMRAVNSYAESNGVPDTNGIPGDPVNGNVLAYYTDINGNRLQLGSGEDWELRAGAPVIPNPLQGGIEAVVTISRTTFLARAIGINNVTAVATATGLWINAQPGGGEYAVFANAPGCNNTLDVSGSDFVISGNLHSNWDIHFGVVPTILPGGKITYVHECSPGSNYGCQVAQQVAPVPWPVYYDIEDYAPGGRAAITATLAGEYHYYDGSDLTSLVGNGLYFVENGGDVKLTSVGTELYSVTIVVRDHSKAKAIQISTSEDHFEPYIDGLLMFTDLVASSPCTVAVIKFSGSEHNWGGVIHAPNGACDMSAASNSTMHGGIFCHVVGLAGSSISVAYDSQYFPDIPPQIRLFR